jgi:hypothetical protein
MHYSPPVRRRQVRLAAVGLALVALASVALVKSFNGGGQAGGGEGEETTLFREATNDTVYPRLEHPPPPNPCPFNSEGNSWLCRELKYCTYIPPPPLYSPSTLLQTLCQHPRPQPQHGQKYLPVTPSSNLQKESCACPGSHNLSINDWEGK